MVAGWRRGDEIRLDARISPLDRVAVRVTTGLLRNCALFDGATILRDEPNRFIAKRAVAPVVTDCSNAALGFSPSGAFLDDPVAD